ncbi:MULTISPECIES: SpvB/TcaC N-terminal domain-containing protein [Burkholderiaceae]|uniref:SpvB/TcaC N-terminal domain-containing protein n=1 Tax=Burkholderiaceae TaxID=119060 RepID=UPI00095AB7EF|nr:MULTISPECIES: SpvB/TcaC N-terminal domain-containing protein [Burkholderiaceae]SIT74808.1 insecticidal toxin complex protein TccC [Burkholderia sp. b13]
MNTTHPAEITAPNVSVPSLSLPKGGGAIQGLGETLSAGGVSGTASLSLPLPLTEVGSATPALALTYSSGAGNSPFGLGMALSVPSIGRRTAKGVPRYTETDEWVDASGTVLVRVGDAPTQTLNGRAFHVTLFAPRVEGGFDRLEYWQAQDDATLAFWRVRAADGAQHLFGYTAAARLADPAMPERIARWWLEETVTPHGEHVYYAYQGEDDSGIDISSDIEQPRERRAQRYLKRVCYGNRQACADLYLTNDTPVPTDWHVELVLDYGEHAQTPEALPTYAPTHAWLARADPFSEYAAGFEVRTHRLCQQVLLFHRFDALGADPVLVRRLYLEYDENPVLTRLRAAWVTGYGPDPASGEAAAVSLPPLEFGFGAFTLDQGQFTPFEPLKGLNDGALYQMVDLYGEGLPGVLYRDGSSYWYRAPIRATLDNDAIAYDAWQPLPQVPVGGLGPDTRHALMDLTGDGQLDWVVAQPGMAGFFSLGPDKHWQAFVPFSAFPTEFLHPDAQLIDLIGAGLPDLALIGPKSVRLYANRREAGFGAPEDVEHAPDRLPSGRGASSELVAVSDVLGSGQSHLVRVRHDALVCWPNLGRGQFGAAIPFAPLPFEPRTFDPARVRLADLDGSGAADLIYLESDRLLIFLNQGGNGFAQPVTLAWPDGVRYDDTCQVSFADVHGTGCAALVLTVPHPSPRHWIVDFVAGSKPYLLERVNNNRGLDTQLVYRSSAQAWLDEKRETPDAVSRLPFPVPLVAQQIQTDEITGNTLTQHYTYRHGFYDGHEREFRGFGYVAHMDTEREALTQPDDDTLSAPVLTKTWYRVGTEQDDAPDADYYAGDEKAPSLGATRWVDDQGEPIAQPDADLLRQMRRALRGHVLREEVYGVDDTPAAAHPYTVSAYRYQVRVVHDAPGARVLLPQQLEQLSVHYERAPDDPMITHDVLLHADAYGYPTEAATVHYPRRINPATPVEYNDPQQQTLRVRCTRHRWIHLDQGPAHWRLGLPCETQTAALQPQASTAESLGYEQLTDGRLDTAPRELIGWQRLNYVDTEGTKLPFGQATLEGLLACTRQAEVTRDQLEQACKDLPSPGDLDQWMAQAKYQKFDEDGNDYYWVESPRAHYLGLSDFYRLSHQTDAFGAQTRIEYDASGYCVTRVTDALGYVTQAEYDYRWLQPTRVIDANENRHEAAYDPLGRIRVTSFYGTQDDREIGFAPVEIYRTAVTTLDAALADPIGAIQHAASVSYDAPLSWMGQLEDGVLSDVEQAMLCQQGLLTSSGQLRARWRWLSAAPPGLSAERWAQIRALLDDAARTPVHTASLVHDGYPDDTHRQIRCTVAFTDGFGRALQAKQRVAPGPAWATDTQGNLALEAGQLVSHDTPTRWAVSGRVEYNNKGLAVRVYQPYFVDTPRYVNDASLRQFVPHDTFYYDPLGRNTRVYTAAGSQRRSRFDVWFDAHEDENDTSDDPLYRDTPMVEVRDNQGLAVREVRYNRTPDISGRNRTPEVPERQVLVTRHEFDASGALVSSADPRHIAKDSVNFRYQRTLSGQLLRTDSVDAGAQLQLRDARGLIMWTATGNGHRQRWTYDVLGRQSARFEQPAGAAEACRERFNYGAPDSDARRNDRGQLIRHADPAGVTEIGGYSLSGQALSATRGFLATLDAPDWPEAETAQTKLLEPERYTTCWTYNALGETLTHTDAGGHCRRFESDMAGQLKTVWLRLAGQHGQDECCVASDFLYNAAGQPLQVCAGNGVVRTYTYEPATQRLTQLRVQREHDKALLQDLNYTYDPVGNITQIDDAAQPVRYTRNQRVTATSLYRYDALYQLVHATGRESARAGQQSAALPPWQGLDDTQRVNYTRDYTYDASGNLHCIQHTGAQDYTLRMTVSTRSNRAVPCEWTEQSDQVHRYFDENGNLTQLQPGQPVDWNACDQLSRTVQVKRDTGDDDDERYAYSDQGQRARKQRRWLAGSQQHTEDVRYLPGLEQREHRQAATDEANQSTVNERLQIIVVEAGGIALRVLHWEVGKPDSIDNDQARYSLGNHLGSSTLELDGEAQLLTYEEYYPYGGTALWAAKSELEAKYKTVRYSGKERDATGLYDYGFRYYVPWLGRWLNPDPAGTVDGFNLYQMVGNNPITRFDARGLYGTVDWLDLPSAPDPSRVTRAVLALPGVQAAYEVFSQQAENFLAEVQQKTEQFNKLKPAQKNKQGDSDTYRPRSKELGDFNAYAAVYKIGTQEYEGGFVNLPASLGKKDTFNGIALQDTSYRINDKKAFMSAIESKYEEGSWLYKRDDDLNQSKRGDPKRINPLHTGIAHLTSLHIQHTERSRQGTLSTFPGVPALHAEVQAFNHALQNGTSMTDIVIFTKRLVGNKLGKAGDDFPACFNCDALLSLVHVTTGRTTADAAYAAAQEAKSSQILARKLEAQVGDLAVPHQTIWRAYRASLGRKAAPTA